MTPSPLLPHPPFYGTGGPGERWHLMGAAITEKDPVIMGAASIPAADRPNTRAWRHYAVATGIGFPATGLWTPQLGKAVEAYQRSRALTPDRVVGPKTMGWILHDAGTYADRLAGTPDGLAAGFARHEGANLLAATNEYDPPGAEMDGTDCGPGQWRLYRPYDIKSLMLAFDAHSALAEAVRTVDARRDQYRVTNRANVAARKPGHHLLSDRSLLEVSILFHNAPFLSLQIINRGHLLTPDAPAAWTRNPATGQPYTHRQWRNEYPARILSLT